MHCLTVPTTQNDVEGGPMSLSLPLNNVPGPGQYVVRLYFIEVISFPSAACQLPWLMSCWNSGRAALCLRHARAVPCCDMH